MAELEHEFKFFLVKNTYEAVPEAIFKIEVINKRLSICMRRVWVFLRTLYLLCSHLWSTSVFVVDEMSTLVALFKLAGHKVVYHKQDKNVGSGFHGLFTDLMLIPSTEGTLHVDKHVVVDPVEVDHATNTLMKLSKHEKLPSVTMVVKPEEKGNL